MIHGYGGSGMIFYQMFKDLASRFKVYLIDIYGMGWSYRPHWDVRSNDECEHFFVESVESWRQKVGLDKFDLVGHSFGGFVVSKYAVKYHQHIWKLVLMSPLGIIEKASDE